MVVSGLEEQALKLLSVCFTSLGAKGRQGEALSISGTHIAALSAPAPPAPHACQLPLYLLLGALSGHAISLEHPAGHSQRPIPAHNQLFKGQLAHCWTLPLLALQVWRVWETHVKCIFAMLLGSLQQVFTRLLASWSKD